MRPSFFKSPSSNISSMDSFLALSIKPQVLTIATSAMATSSTSSYPAAFSFAISSSPST